jgi:hypothetical protein
MPLSHLIALIINAHPLGSGPGERSCERFDRPDIDLERPACFGSFRRRAVKQPT